MSTNSTTAGGNKRSHRSRSFKTGEKGGVNKSNESKNKNNKSNNKNSENKNANKSSSSKSIKSLSKTNKRSSSNRKRRSRNRNQDLEGFKLVVRLLPPNLTEEQFFTTIKDTLHDDNFIKTFNIVQSYYVEGRYSIKLFNEPTCARGYLLFNDMDNLKKFGLAIKDIVFVDDRDNATKPTLRMSSYSKRLNKIEITPGKKNLFNSLENDRVFKIFLNSLKLLEENDETNYMFNGKISLLKPLEKELNKQKELETIIKRKTEIALVQLAGAPKKDKKKKKKKKSKKKKNENNEQAEETTTDKNKIETPTVTKKKKKPKKKLSKKDLKEKKNKVVIPNNNVVILETAGKKELQKRKKLQQKKELEKPKLKYNVSAASFIPETSKYNTGSESFQFKISSPTSSDKNGKFAGD